MISSEATFFFLIIQTNKLNYQKKVGSFRIYYVFPNREVMFDKYFSPSN